MWTQQSLQLPHTPAVALLLLTRVPAAHKLIIPRRPPWDETTTPDQLDAQEKAAFLNWRR